MKVDLEFKLQDLWVGIFWKHKPSVMKLYYKHGGSDLVPMEIKTDIWICIIPCFPIHITIRRKVLAQKVKKSIK